jgi:hypothetical protein
MQAIWVGILYGYGVKLMGVVTYLKPHRVVYIASVSIFFSARVEILIIYCVCLHHEFSSKGKKALLFITLLNGVCILIETFNFYCKRLLFHVCVCGIQWHANLVT